MPENKRQHFVPKYTLRRFSCDPKRKPEPRQINLVNIAQLKIIRGASLREQCYRDYFYGKNTAVEKRLGDLEGYFSTLTRTMIDTKSINEPDGWHLVQMVALQKARTMFAEEDINSIADRLIKLAMHNRIEEEALRRIKISVKDAASYNIAQALTLSPLVLDLKRLLIVNQTDVPFVIADNPVVCTNWFARTRHPHRSTGLTRSGLQMLLPLSPHVALLMHDSNVYWTDSQRNVIRLKHRDEVVALNQLQWLNAYKNVYFPPGVSDGLLRSMMSECARPNSPLSEFRRMERVGDSYQPNDKDEFAPPSEGVTCELILMSAKSLPKDVRLRAIRLREKPVFHDDGSIASPQRDPVWKQIVTDFAHAARAGQARLSTFWEFVEVHPLTPSIGVWLRRATRQANRRG